VGWENEAYLLVDELGKDKFEIVNPSVSVLAEPSVALVDKNVDKHGTRAPPGLPEVPVHARGPGAGGETPLPPAQTPDVAKKYAAAFPKIKACSRSTRSSAAGPRPRRRTSPTTASSIKSSSRANDPLRPVRAVLAGFVPIPGRTITLTWLSLIVLIPLAGLVLRRRS